MLQYLINVTNTILPTLLVLAVLVGFIRQQSVLNGKSCLVLGSALGTLTALVLAFMRLTTGFVIRELYNAPVLFIAIVAGVFLFIYLFRMLGKSHSDLSKKTPGSLIFILGFAWFAYAMPEMFLYPFEFNIGMDTIFNAPFLYKVIGYLLALLLSLLISLALYKIITRFTQKQLLLVLMACMLVFGGKQILSFVQIAVLRGWLPQYSWLMELVMFFLEYQDIFIYGLLVIAVAVAVMVIHKNKTSVFEGINPADRRKLIADSRSQVRWGSLVLFNTFLFVVTLTLGVELKNKVVELSPPIELPPTAEQIIIQLEKVHDGHLHRFSYTAEDGTQVRYIVIKKNDVAYGIGLDACDVCGPSGYYERDGQVICILCDVVMNISTIGFKGGCNPVPLAYSMEDGNLVIKIADLESEAHRFR